MFYVSRGNVPHKRHPTPPTQTHLVVLVAEVVIEDADDGYHHHRLIGAAGVKPHGDAITGRIPCSSTAIS